MAKGRLGGALRDVQTLFQAGTSGGLTDGQLLEEFRDRGGEARSAPSRPWSSGTARRSCAPAARSSATSTRRRTPSRRSSSSWRARPARCGCGTRWPPGCTRSPSGSPDAPESTAARRTRHERRAAERADPTARDPDADDLGPVLHEEIDRLPDRYRAPIVLCFLEGLTREQAAGQLRWPLGTLQSRLARGRERLRHRLIRRGLAPSAILPDAVLRAETARPVVPAALADADGPGRAGIRGGAAGDRRRDLGPGRAHRGGPEGHVVPQAEDDRGDDDGGHPPGGGRRRDRGRPGDAGGDARSPAAGGGDRAARRGRVATPRDPAPRRRRPPC